MAGIKLTGVWKQTNEQGTRYSGKVTMEELRKALDEAGDVSACYLTIYKNDRKEPHSRQPDLNVYLYPVEERREDRQAAGQSARSGGDDFPYDEKEESDDIPF